MKELPNSSRPLETLHKDDLYTPAEPTAEIQSWKETARVASLTNSPRCEPSAPLDDARQSRPIQPPGRGRVGRSGARELGPDAQIPSQDGSETTFRAP